MRAKLLITNLPPELDSSTLEDMFTMVGDVRTAFVVRDESSRGIGHVEMMTEEEAKNGIERFHGQVKFGNRLIVREDAPHVGLIKPVKSSQLGRRMAATATNSKLMNAKKRALKLKGQTQ